MWKRFLWPEFEVFWFNSVLNRSSEWVHILFTGILLLRCLTCYLLHIHSLCLESYLREGFFPWYYQYCPLLYCTLSFHTRSSVSLSAQFQSLTYLLQLQLAECMLFLFLYLLQIRIPSLLQLYSL